MIFVGVTGGRNYADRAAVKNAIAALDEREQNEIVIIHGDARGADKLAQYVCEELAIQYGAFPALWNHYGDGAGHRRNAIMAALPLRYLLAFPGGIGTADMVRRCRAKGIEVIEVKP